MHFGKGGSLYASYFIFIKCAGAYSDADMLLRFGLTDYQRVPAPLDFGPYVCLMEDSEWTHIADDWSYTLWHRPSTWETIAEIAKDHDVFACSIGDCDYSWQFVYYRHGRLLRKYVVDDPHYQKGGMLVEDFGIPLEGETEAKKQTDELGTVLTIAASLGIDVAHRTKEIRVYAPLVK